MIDLTDGLVEKDPWDLANIGIAEIATARRDALALIPVNPAYLSEHNYQTCELHWVYEKWIRIRACINDAAIAELNQAFADPDPPRQNYGIALGQKSRPNA